MAAFNSTKYLLQIFFFFLCFTQLIRSQEVSIYSNWDKTIETAKKEDKQILVILTGSEWCAPCKKMEERVIQNPEFRRYVQKNLILFIIDIPKGVIDMDSKIYKDYTKFEKKYKTKSMPALVLTDKKGTIVKKLKGRLFSLKNVMKQLIS